MQTDRPLGAALLAARPFWQVCLYGLIAVVGYLALTPTPRAALTSGWDKLNHLLAFAALAWSGALGFGRGRSIWRVVAALMTFGAAVEICQLFVPGRSGEWADLLADAIGTTCGTGLALLVGPRSTR